MKKVLFFACAAIFSSGLFAQEDYELKVLTFENLSEKIDNPQYMGSLLYGTGMGFDSEKDAYSWSDSTTGLCHTLPLNWGSYCFWTGGEAVSNYNSGEEESYGDYNNQLTVYKNGVTGIATTGGGHNGSNNFAVHYGYRDQSGWSADILSSISFGDGKARIVDHMYINNTCYALNVFGNGNGLSDKIAESDWVKVLAIGYDEDNMVTDTASIFLCNGPANIINDWTKFDLSSLGRVVRIEFNVTGSSDNGYGFSQPAYFAYDDVAVRFYKSEELSSQPSVATFEDFALADTIVGVNAWKSGDYNFYTYADISEWGSYFYAFSISSETESVSSGYTEPYRSAAGGAYEGNNFAIWSNDYYGTNGLNLTAAAVVPGFMVCNNAYTVNEMQNGGYAKKFDSSDWLTLYCIGKKNGAVVDTIRCELAKDGKYINQWTYVDLSSLGEIDELVFSMDGSDKGQWGLNTPAYFCLDNFGMEMPDGYVVPQMASFTTTSVENTHDNSMMGVKIFRNGQILIERENHLYDVMGNIVQ